MFGRLKVYNERHILLLLKAHRPIVCRDIGYLYFKDLITIFKIIARTAFKSLSVQDYDCQNYS